MKKFYLENTFLTAEAVVQGCSQKKVFLEICKIYRKTHVPQSLFLIKLQASSCKISENTFFYRTPLVAASLTGHLVTTASDT